MVFYELSDKIKYRLNKMGLAARKLKLGDFLDSLGGFAKITVDYEGDHAPVELLEEDLPANPIVFIEVDNSDATAALTVPTGILKLYIVRNDSSNALRFTPKGGNYYAVAAGDIAVLVEITAGTFAKLGDNAQINDIANQIADIKGYIGYTEDDIYGVEVDFANRTFTRLAGAVGKTPGTDFDSFLAFGGRKRCDLADNGTVNAYFGDPGYIEDGSNGQVMVEQPKFYYKVVPLKMEKNDAAEVVSLAFTAGASADGNITITLNGVAFNVAVANGDTATAVAGKVRGTTFAGWTTSGSGATVVFTATKVGVMSETTFTDTGSTGVTATITRTQPGYIGNKWLLLFRM
jgi:hypothetical protein